MKSLELRIPPLALVLAAALLMWLAAWAFPGRAWLWPGRSFAALALVVLGFLVTVSGLLAFRRARTTVNPMHPESASSVVSGGIYRFTRNPMYLGFLLALAGWWVQLGLHAVALLPLAGFVAWMHRFQIAPEERALREKFGPAYTSYTQQVRRWL